MSIDFSRLNNKKYTNEIMNPINFTYYNIPSNKPLTYFGVKTYPPQILSTNQGNAYISFPPLRDPTVVPIPFPKLQQRYI